MTTSLITRASEFKVPVVAMPRLDFRMEERQGGWDQATLTYSRGLIEAAQKKKVNDRHACPCIATMQHLMHAQPSRSDFRPIINHPICRQHIQEELGPLLESLF